MTTISVLVDDDDDIDRIEFAEADSSYGYYLENYGGGYYYGYESDEPAGIQIHSGNDVVNVRREDVPALERAIFKARQLGWCD